MLIIVVCVLAATAHGAADEYLLAPGDVLQISVWGHPDLLTIVQIRPDGKIGVPPLTGDIVASGKSSSQLANELMERMKELIVSPRVTVVVKEFRTIQVRLFGEVQVPGLYDLKPESTISELLARAGGLTPEASISEIKITRDGQLEIVDFAQIVSEGRRDQFSLESGDIVFVPKERKALVLGEVNVPGAYTVREGTRILDLLSLAGGYSKEADLRQVVLQRGDDQHIVDLEVIRRSGGGANNIEICAGDIMYVPKAEQVVILGQVNNPGAFQVMGDLSLLELIAMAGNTTEGALIDQISITRKVGGQQERIVVDLDAILQKDQNKPDIPIFGGDVVFVPKAEREVIVFGQVQRPGSYDLRPGSRLTDAIAIAGGITELGDATKVSISSKDQAEPVVVDVKDAISARPKADNPHLSGGDIIYVPETKRHAIVLGEVRNPGTYVVEEGVTIYELLALAGGLDVTADKAKISITRQTSDAVLIKELDLGDALRQVVSDEVLVRPGDVVYVPEDNRGVLLLGEVRNPGYFKIAKELTVLDVLALGGGPTPQADLSAASLSLRVGDDVRLIEIDLEQVLARPFSETNRLLEGGEVLIVPKVERQVVILGEIRVPGGYEILPEATLLDMIALAGGPTERANLGEVSLTRQTATGPVLCTIDVSAILSNTKPEDNLPIEPRDVIYVPKAQKQVVVLGEVQSPGVFDIQEDIRLLDALAMSGGVAEHGDAENVHVLLKDGTRRVFNVQKTMSDAPDGLLSPIIEPGGVVYVPRARRDITVLGEVTRPGTYTVIGPTRLLDALAMAEGTTPEADIDLIWLTSEDRDQPQRYSLLEAKADPKGPLNPILSGGDVIYIEKAEERQVVVFGEVNAPGVYNLEPGQGLLEIIGQAKGFSSFADVEAVALRRIENGSFVSKEINCQTLLQDDGSSNIPLVGGDVIFVPKRVRQVTVLGAVARPGRYTLESSASILDVLGLAGGLAKEANASGLMLSRPEGAELEKIDLEAVEQQPNIAQNIMLSGGETIVVPQMATEVLIFGEVRSPGAYAIKGATSALEVVARAGGFTLFADTEEVTISRLTDEGYSPIQTQFDLVTPDVVRGGDVIYVPRVERHIWVLGEVRNPGVFQVDEKGLSIMQLLALAGGLTSKADATKINVHVDERSLVVGLDGENQPQNRLVGGEVVYVPATRQGVLVVGEVRNPGYYVPEPGSRVLDLIAMAGGLNEQTASMQGRLSRFGNESDPLPIDLAALVYQGDPKENLVIHGGDVLFIPKENREVVVLGEVRIPGRYTIAAGHDRLLDIIGLAGGLNANARQDAVRIIRADGKQEEIDFVEALTNSDFNLGLKPQDMIYVPRDEREVLVLGEVTRPGHFGYQKGLGPLELLSKAGGATEDADLSGAYILRKSADGSYCRIPADLGKLTSQDVDGFVHILAGDVLYLPRANRRVLILGEVNRPGTYLTEPGDTLLDLIGKAQGPTVQADLERVSLSRDDRTEVLDAKAMMGDVNQDNPLLVGGDIVFIPRANRQVLVLGQVNNPGYYIVDAGARVLDVLAMAKDITPKADPSKVTLVRDEDEIRIYTMDLNAVRQQYDLTSNIEVQGGDVLIVPEGEHDALILGEVSHPGTYPVKEGERLFNLITKAGGLAQDELGEAIVVRKAAMEPRRIVVDLQTVLHEPDSSDNVEVFPGDLVYIPLVRRQVSVLGAVNRPGQYTLLTGDSLLDMVAKAGGLRDDADGDSIIVGDESGEEIYSLTRIASGLMDSPLLSPGCAVYVPMLTQQVLVFGEVRNPGAYPLGTNNRLVDIIALAGGVTDRANTQSITLSRADGAVTHVFDLFSLYKLQGDDVRISPGDIVYVPRARNVMVLGQVRSPGAYLLPQGSRLLDAISLAGGVLPGASLDQITITRTEDDQDVILQADFHALTHQLALNTNYPIQEGDVIFVPEAKLEVVVLGQVKQPGMYSIGPDTRVMDVIAMAGGPTERAALQSVGIYRGADVSQVGEASLGDKLLFEGDVKKANPIVVGGDIIYVPETTSPDWNTIFQFLTGVKLFKDLVTGW